jgi:CDP-4-dehydro-6-deoxyglucose reductase
MSELLSLTRAARLVGVNRAALQKKIQCGEMTSFDGMVSADALLSCFPDAQLEENAELARVLQIKERAFGKRVFERALPDAEVLAVRITELSTTLAGSQAQVKQFNALINRLWDKFEQIAQDDGKQAILPSLKTWLKEEVEAAMEPGFSNPLAIRDGMLRVMTAHVTVLPGKQDFLVEGQDTLLEAAMRAGIPLNYGCSGGNCGLCKAKVVSGRVKKTRHHDFALSETEKNQGCILMCSNTAISDVVLEAGVAGSVQDIPFQQITARVKSVELLSGDVLLLHLQTPRSQRLRFLAGQRVTLRVGSAYTAELSVASCPCDDRNILFHVKYLSGNLFSEFVFNRLKAGDEVGVEGPQGEFILHEKSERALYCLAFDGGFAPIKSLVEHAMSLETERIHLYWIASTQQNIYMPNVGRAWSDALDCLEYREQVAGFDLALVGGKREAPFLNMLEALHSSNPEISMNDVYLAGPEAAVLLAEKFFLAADMPKSRVFIEIVQ